MKKYEKLLVGGLCIEAIVMLAVTTICYDNPVVILYSLMPLGAALIIITLNRMFDS